MKNELKPPTSLSLRVQEADKQDAGRSIARIDPILAAELSLRTGDVVFIEGKRLTVATVYPGYPADAGHGTIRIDGATRHNAGVGIDDRVKVHRADKLQDARAVNVAPVEKPVGPFNIQARVAEHLVGRPLVKHDVMLLDLMGTRVQLVVTSHEPAAEAVLVTPATKVTVAAEPTKESKLAGKVPRVTYEDIGGLGPQIRKVREMIELPLRHPEVFQKLGVEAPKGVLLHGPPGTGKTLLVKAVANETQSAFFNIGGPEIMSKFHGQSEENLREVFDKARENAPSILFIDEIDSIAPKREDAGGEVERRVVAQLLSLMDGLEERGRVVVLAATNRPDSIDPALRRPGRFDREIEISVPDARGRKAILQVHTRGMPLADDVDLDDLAARSHGFVGADLAALCREAALHSVRRLLPDLDLDSGELPPGAVDKLQVTKSDLESALTQMTPSAMREVAIERPTTTWDQVGGLKTARQELAEAIEWPLKHGGLYRHMGAEIPKGILLHGPPGTGKTLLAKALANEAGVNFISIKGPELLSKWVGESERGVREVFRKARQSAPCIVFLDEVDALASSRGLHMGDSGVTERVVSQFLTELDGLSTLRNVTVLAATNRKDLLDPALLRPGRFDRVVDIGLPDKATREEILRIHTKRLPLEKGVDLAALADKTEGWNGAELAAIAHEASLLAVRGYVESGKDPADEKAFSKSKVTLRHLNAAYDKVAARRGPAA
jgi:transitional endoplasmic reticulum ATPase